MLHFSPNCTRSRIRAATETLLTASALALAMPHDAFAGDSIFADGFDSCDASGWTSSTGVPDCSTELDCATPSAGEACVAGRLLDVETSARICSSPVISTACTGSELGGPCALAVHLSEALTFLSDPPGAPPLAADETLVDGCGRFRVSGFTAPGFGGGALSVDDAEGAPDDHALAADFSPIASGAKVEHLRLYAVRHATDQAWTSTAGSPFAGDTFVETGTYAAIFLHDGVPVSGVQLLSDGSAVTDDDYYFSDAQASSRSVVDAGATSTGTNGTALFVLFGFSDVSGSGSEPPGCSWPSVPGASGPGLVIVHEMEAEVTGQPGNPCP